MVLSSVSPWGLSLIMMAFFFESLLIPHVRHQLWRFWIDAHFSIGFFKFALFSPSYLLKFTSSFNHFNLIFFMFSILDLFDDHLNKNHCWLTCYTIPRAVYAGQGSTGILLWLILFFYIFFSFDWLMIWNIHSDLS